MASIVFGAGTSHTPMLYAAAEEWPLFEELDRQRPHLHKDGRRATYEELLAVAPPFAARRACAGKACLAAQRGDGGGEPAARRRADSATSRSTRCSTARSFARCGRRTRTHCKACRARSSIPAAPRSATGFAPPARSNISICAGCTTTLAIARLRAPAPVCASRAGPDGNQTVFEGDLR
jgi:hypothetical protein